MRVRVHINFNNSLGAIFTPVSYPEVVNVANISSMHTEPSLGCKGFQLSPSREEKVSVLDSTYNFYSQSGYPGVLTQQISDGSGRMLPYPTINFRLTGTSFEDLYIVFDSVSGEYAKIFALIVNDTLYTITNESVFVHLKMDEYIPIGPGNSNELNCSLQIVQWSKPYSSAKITYLSNVYADIFSGGTLESVVCSENSLNSETTVQPGMVEQYADIVFYDRNGRLHAAADSNRLLENVDVKITAIHSDNNVTQLGSYKASSWKIEADDSYVQLTCTDPSVNFDKIYIENVPVKNRSLHDMLTLCFSYATGYSWKYDNATTSNYCKTIITPNSWFQNDTLSNTLQKVCTAGMLRIYWFNNMFIVTRCAL